VEHNKAENCLIATIAGSDRKCFTTSWNRGVRSSSPAQSSVPRRAAYGARVGIDYTSKYYGFPGEGGAAVGLGTRALEVGALSSIA
jgi:hypothetical protein